MNLKEEENKKRCTSSLEGFTITDGNKSGRIIGSTSALGILADGVLGPNNRTTVTRTTTIAQLGAVTFHAQCRAKDKE